MKLPRWALILVWSFVTFAITSVCVWWVAMPYQIAMRFRTAVAYSEFDRANQLLTNGEWQFVERDFAILQSRVNTISLTPKDWQAAVDDGAPPKCFASFREVLSGTRNVTARTQFGTLSFTAHNHSVSFDGLTDRGTAGWGLSVAGSTYKRVAISGGYSCADPRGGSILISLNGEDLEPVPALFGSGVFSLVHGRPNESLLWVVRLSDVDGVVQKELSLTMTLSASSSGQLRVR